MAPTDTEARELAINGMMGRCWREFMLPLYFGLGLGPLLKRDPSMPDAAVDLEYLADNLWFVGSPETVADRILDLQAKTGGFGSETCSSDPQVESRTAARMARSRFASDERVAWDRSLRLLMNEVLPRCQVSENPTKHYA